jgi:uncharacterized protein (TIGR00730 family)
MNIRQVTVYAASSARVAPAYFEAARTLGRAIAAQGWVQVNGGGATGLMAAVSDGGLAAGGEVRAVILEDFRDRGFLHQGLRDVEVVTDMPARKRGLYEGSDAYIALPGGLGTLEELFEVLSWRQLGFHERPIAMLDVLGFYGGLGALLTHTAEQSFIAPGFEDAYTICDDVDRLIAWVKDYRPRGFSVDSKV